ncbi:MAG: hypothetical protein M0038_05815 [Pseudomonadota bacterium]|nr:hypothetical protein [Pseudomonadota bacterium]
MTHRTERDFRPAIVAALYGEQPPPGASPEVLREWIVRQVDLGRSEGETATASGLTVTEVRRAIAERAPR